MDPTEVRAELAARLAVIPDQTPHAYPPGRLVAPAIVVQPVSVAYDEAYDRGEDMLTVSIVAVGGKLHDRACHERLDAWAAGSGPTSVKTVLESGTYTAFDSVTVMAGQWEPVTFESIDHLAVIFTAEVSGSGE